MARLKAVTRSAARGRANLGPQDVVASSADRSQIPGLFVVFSPAGKLIPAAEQRASASRWRRPVRLSHHLLWRSMCPTCTITSDWVSKCAAAQKVGERSISSSHSIRLSDWRAARGRDMCRAGGTVRPVFATKGAVARLGHHLYGNVREKILVSTTTLRCATPSRCPSYSHRSDSLDKSRPLRDQSSRRLGRDCDIGAARQPESHAQLRQYDRCR